MKILIQLFLLSTSVFLFGDAYKANFNVSENSNVNALFKLGVRYERSQGVAMDMNKSIFLYKQAAEKGHTQAQYNLGNIYREGKYVTKDYKKSFYYYRLSAEKNFMWAQFNLARMYLEGMGTKKDYKKAFKLFKLLADKGVKNAQYQLANMYYKGYGSKQNYRKAIELWEKAINKKCPRAKNELRKFYEQNKDFYKRERLFLQNLKLFYKNSIDVSTLVLEKNLKTLVIQYQNIVNLFPSRLFIDEITNDDIPVRNWLKFIDTTLIYFQTNNDENLNKSIYAKHLFNAKSLMLNSDTMLDYLISLSAYKKLYFSKVSKFKYIQNVLKKYSPLPKIIFFEKLDDEKSHLINSVKVLGNKFLEENKLKPNDNIESINTITEAAKNYSEKYFAKIKKAIINNSLQSILEIEKLLENDKEKFLKNKKNINESVGKLFVIMLIKPITYYKAYDEHDKILKLYNSFLLPK